ncbi:universal stress protein [soil metagenome]
MRRLLVAVDFSKHSVNALRRAGHLAVADGATLHVVHVISPEAIEDIQELRPVSTDRILADATARLDALVSSHLGAIRNKPETTVLVGYAYHELVRFSRDLGVDLLLMGSRGETEEADHHTGTIATKCVRRAPVPVLLVREGQTAPFEKVVACIDFSPTSAKALLFASDIARLQGASLSLIHAYYPPWLRPSNVLYNLTQSITEGEKSRYMEGLRQRMADFVSAHCPGDVTSETHLLERANSAYAIVDFLRRSGADLVVLGTRGRTGVKALLLGTTAERLVHESPCSVLIVKPD